MWWAHCFPASQPLTHILYSVPKPGVDVEGSVSISSRIWVRASANELTPLPVPIWMLKSPVQPKFITTCRVAGLLGSILPALPCHLPRRTLDCINIPSSAQQGWHKETRREGGLGSFSRVSWQLLPLSTDTGSLQ